MLLILLTLIDIHTLLVLLFHNYMAPLYIFAGSSFALAKGTMFYLSSRDLFSLFDIIVGVLMLFLLIGDLFIPIKWIIGLYLTYKIILGFMSF